MVLRHPGFGWVGYHFAPGDAEKFLEHFAAVMRGGKRVATGSTNCWTTCVGGRMPRLILFVAAGLAIGAAVASALGETTSIGAGIGAAFGVAAVIWNVTHK